MTDNEIIKALECCIIHEDCTGCPLQEDNTQYCLKATCKNALDLINRQQEEIERLKRLLERAEKDQITLSKQCYKSGIKEFAERLHKEAEEIGIDQEGDFIYSDDKIYDTVADWCKDASDNLVKEMVGEE